MPQPITPEYLARSGTEYAEQSALFCWKALNVEQEPRLKWLHAIHNQGHGDAIRGARNKAAGVVAGVCDVMLPVTCSLYAGLYIELKKCDKGKLEPVQSDFIRYATGQGYYARVCWGWKAARDEILRYLSMCPR